MKAKKTLVRRSIFCKPLPNLLELLVMSLRLAYTKITDKTVIQIATNTFGIDRINYQVLEMI